MITINLNSKKYTQISAYLRLYKKSLLPILTLCLIPSIGSAWSYSSNYGNYSASISYDVSRETSVKNSLPSSTVTDICKSLLQSNHHIPSNSVTDRSQRITGKITALAIMLGVNFALEPQKQDTQKHTQIKVKPKDSPRSALSIAAFRKCQKDYALSKIAYIK